MEYIPEESMFPRFTATTPPSPPTMDKYSLGAIHYVSFVPSRGTSSSRGSKRKTPMVDEMNSQFDKLTAKPDGFMT